MSGMLSRTTPLLRNPAVFRVRLAAPARFASGHGTYHHLPFEFPGKKNLRFALKLTVCLGGAFSIPFLATSYQLSKKS